MAGGAFPAVEVAELNVAEIDFFHQKKNYTKETFGRTPVRLALVTS